MPNIGPVELGIVLVVALVVLGPKRLPEFGRSAGSGIREFKESLTKGEPELDAEAGGLTKSPSQVASRTSAGAGAPG